MIALTPEAIAAAQAAVSACGANTVLVQMKSVSGVWKWSLAMFFQRA